MEEAYGHSLALLRAVSTPQGFLASNVNVDNYRRIWARDGVICGLAGLLSGEEDLALTFKAHLETLAAHQTDLGHIPSNVALGSQTEVSLGGLCGRVDTIAWFIIGVCNYAHFAQDLAFAQRLKPNMEQGMRLMQAWEFNNRGLMYVPRSGDWADEYVLHGYVLYDQLLRLWALKAFSVLFGEKEAEAQSLQQLLEINYWHNSAQEGLYHANAMKQAQASGHYWLPAFNPGGYQTQFDAWANALALLLRLGTPAQRQVVAGYAIAVSADLPAGLLPAFWPPIAAGDEEWSALSNNHKYAFRNRPFEFHNGGSWAVINGFLGCRAVLFGAERSGHEPITPHTYANRLSDGQEEWGFYENLHTQTQQPIGTKYCAWSAAGAVMLQAYLQGKSLLGA